MNSRKLPGQLAAVDRRQLIALLSTAAAGAALTPSARFSLLEMFGGTALAQARLDAQPTCFIEVNLRDQWDFGHFMVPPGLAQSSTIKRGDSGRLAALYYASGELRHPSDTVYLTADSAALEPHAASIATVDLCELTVGPVHGHEAANATRSPGRGYAGGSGRAPMWLKDPATSDGGNAYHYSATPTPACLHNLAQKRLTPGLANGFAFKGVGRTDHTVYHFDAGLSGADLDRYQGAGEFLAAIAGRSGRILPSKAQADALVAAMKRLDRRALLRLQLPEAQLSSHDADLDTLAGLVFSPTQTTVDLTLTPAERSHWCDGIPAQVAASPSAPLGEQFAYITKMFKAGLARTAVAEYGYTDIHGGRVEAQVRAMAKQIAIPLARLIDELKASGLYEHTLIAVYSTDGGRAPAADSFGSEGKNTVVLAGGMIRGGYYGDIQVAGPDGDGNSYRYHRPDASSGLPDAAGTLGNGQRVRGAEMWQTVMTALQVPADLTAGFADAAAAPLKALLL